MTDTYAITYSPTTVSTEDLSEELERLWGSLATDDRLRTEVRKHGFDPDQLLTDSPTPPFQARVGPAGFFGEAVILVAAGIVAKDLWQQVLLPRIKARFGANSMGEEQGEERE